jgi:HSP20 family protein
MKLAKYNPILPKSVSSLFDDMFSRSLGDFFGSDFFLSQPSINVVETKDNYRIEVAAPGLEKEDFIVNVDNGFLNISAKKEQKEEVNEGNYMRREFNFSSFTRSFELPAFIDADDVGAHYENGILSITLPKKEEAKTEVAKVIEIK